MLQKSPLVQSEHVPVQTTAERRALRRLLRAVMAFVGNDPPKPSSNKRRRLLYRSPRSLTDADLDRLVIEIGADRWWSAAERATRPHAIAAE